MAEEASNITPEAKAYIGRTLVKEPVEVTKRDIRRFAISIGDSNPLYHDEEYAKKTSFGGIIGPPFFYTALTLDEEPLEDLEESGLGKKMGLRMAVPVPGFVGAMAAGRDITFGVPIRPGDLITVEQTITDIFEKKGSRGPMVFIIDEWTFRNQRGEVAVRSRETLIRVK